MLKEQKGFLLDFRILCLNGICFLAQIPYGVIKRVSAASWYPFPFFSSLFPYKLSTYN